MNTPKRLAALAAVAALAFAGCGGGAAATPVNDHVLRIAMGSPGEAQIRVWDDVAAQYMKAHPETKVEINYQQDDLYETIGLQNLLNGKNPPDIYFEWTGARLAQRVKDGFGADLTEAFKTGPLKGIWDDAVTKQYTLDGKTVMVPYAADVTNVLWYNKQIFLENGLKAPATFDDLLAVCDALNAKGIIPIASGNKDLWAAGNWLAHQTSRVVGEDAYAAVLGGTGKFDTPEWEQAFDYIVKLRDHKCVNDSANAIDDNAGAQLFFQGKAAMHAIGSWLVSWAIDEAPDLAFDYVNLPAMPSGAKGNQGSVIGVATGYIVNAKSAKITEATEFMALLNSEANVKAFIEAEVTPLAKSASAGQAIDARTTSLNALLNDAPAIVLPPDTGYDLKMADAFYTAISEVLGGQKSPKDALSGIDAKLKR
jgi:raffinose/stachyose/melibiose transport system substrate-binding protein